MVSVPVRVAPGFASNVNVAMPLPFPVAVVCSQESLAVAVHEGFEITWIESDPAAGPSRVLVPASCVTKMDSLVLLFDVLVSAQVQDTEALFCSGDVVWAATATLITTPDSVPAPMGVVVEQWTV